MDEYPVTPLSVEHCKDLLRTIAKMFCIKAELISTRLLSSDDKDDMVNGLVPIDSLVTAVRVWKENGMPDYTNGTCKLYRAPI